MTNNINIENEIKSAQELLNSCRLLEAEINEMKSNTDFLLNEYRTNKKWFRPEPGRTTVEDVIKAAFEFGWACGRNWERDNA